MRMGDLDRAGAVSATLPRACGEVVWVSHPLQPCEENPRHSGATEDPRPSPGFSEDWLSCSRTSTGFRVTLGLSSASLNFSVSLRNDEVGMGLPDDL